MHLSHPLPAWFLALALLTCLGVALATPLAAQSGTVSFTSAAWPINEAAGTALLSVARTGGSGGEVSVDYSTGDGDATPGFDYTATTGTLTWGNGDSANKSVMIPILNDSLFEGFGPEVFKVTLSSATGGATIGPPAVATVSIFDDDSPPSGACQPSDATLCLNDFRFAVTVDWVTQVNDTGLGHAVPLTEDSGYFWFFRDGNVELVIKVLDACTMEVPRFWVFFAGLTNVGVTITVLDTETDTEKVYQNPLGTKFETELDVDGFATCP